MSSRGGSKSIGLSNLNKGSGGNAGVQRGVVAGSGELGLKVDVVLLAGLTVGWIVIGSVVGL